MEPLPPVAEESVLRSGARARVLVVLSSLGVASISQLARMTGLSWRRVRAALVGEAPDYSIDRSLVGAGLARELPPTRRRQFEVTERGRRKARSLVARVTRARSGVDRFLHAERLVGRAPPAPARRGAAWGHE